MFYKDGPLIVEVYTSGYKFHHMLDRWRELPCSGDPYQRPSEALWLRCFKAIGCPLTRAFDLCSSSWHDPGENFFHLGAP